MIKNIINYHEAIATNNSTSPGWSHALVVHKFNCSSDNNKIKVALENLINTFGEGMVRAVMMNELNLKTKAVKKVS